MGGMIVRVELRVVAREIGRFDARLYHPAYPPGIAQATSDPKAEEG